MVTVGLSDNSVEFYNINTSRRRENNYSAPDSVGGGGGGGGGSNVELIKRVVCTDRCLLYSMNLHLDTTNRVCYVAGGTIFLDVVVWKAEINNLDTTTSNGNGGGGGDGDLSSSSSSCCESFSDVLYRLKGHEGSIHSVRWSPSGTVLASGSDDRTVRIWDIILENKNYFKIGDEKEVSLCPRKVLYGHSARLWGFCFTQDESIVISCSEDRTCKFWNILETKEKKEEKKEESYFASLKAHRYRGVWHCCLQGSILYTGGADGAIKAWNLWDVLQPEYVERILKSSSCSLMAAATAPPLLLPLTASSNGAGASSSLGGIEEDVHNGCSWVATSLQCDLPDSESTTVGTITTPAAGAAAAAVVVEQQIQSSSSSSSSDATKKAPKTAVDSSSEWVRCLAITKDHSTLFVATNRGLVHQVQLPAVPLQPLPTHTTLTLMDAIVF
jgi:WD40 repeat protein